MRCRLLLHRHRVCVSDQLQQLRRWHLRLRDWGSPLQRVRRGHLLHRLGGHDGDRLQLWHGGHWRQPYDVAVHHRQRQPPQLRGERAQLAAPHRAPRRHERHAHLLGLQHGGEL